MSQIYSSNQDNNGATSSEPKRCDSCGSCEGWKRYVVERSKVGATKQINDEKINVRKGEHLIAIDTMNRDDSVAIFVIDRSSAEGNQNMTREQMIQLPTTTPENVEKLCIKRGYWFDVTKEEFTEEHLKPAVRGAAEKVDELTPPTDEE